jgi:hypothetical protein
MKCVLFVKQGLNYNFQTLHNVTNAVVHMNIILAPTHMKILHVIYTWLNKFQMFLFQIVLLWKVCVVWWLVPFPQ